MKNIYLILLMAATLPFTTQAKDAPDLNKAFSLYCGSKHGEFKEQIIVGDGTELKLNQGPYNQVQMLNKVSPDKYLIQSVLSEDSFSQQTINKQCEEYLLKSIISEHQSVSVSQKGKVLARVYFSFNNSTLNSRSKYVLDQLIKSIKTNKHPLNVVGNTDSIGSIAYNAKLGQKRSDSVVKYLADHGIDPSLLTASSDGKTHPIASNKTAKGREKNRRTDVKLN
ncbi:OmpA family protein [Vibrio sp. S4M6]|uniref:OmpA family protein n=1 Tax=Vibrio sinus TaxID=2946865 RepID=UPI00202A1EF5|nr:OmpA family protein [Vibrio sinus]MCL9780805.1 OmpA family protein [Vibrio sinus]